MTRLEKLMHDYKELQKQIALLEEYEEWLVEEIGREEVALAKLNEGDVSEWMR